MGPIGINKTTQAISKAISYSTKVDGTSPLLKTACTQLIGYGDIKLVRT